MWGEMYTQYKELAMGFSTQNISRMGHTSRGFTGKRLIGYPESHDKDRMMYEAVTYGNGKSEGIQYDCFRKLPFSTTDSDPR